MTPRIARRLARIARELHKLEGTNTVKATKLPPELESVFDTLESYAEERDGKMVLKTLDDLYIQMTAL